MRNETRKDAIYEGAQEYGRRAADRDDDYKHRDWRAKRDFATGYREAHLAWIIDDLLSSNAEDRARGRANAEALIALGNEVQA